MNKITHQTSDEELDELCRDLVLSAGASEQEINAAANAPFLYSRLQARIAAEPALRISALTEKEKRRGWQFNFFTPQTWQWGWALAATALALVALIGWYGLRSSTPAPIAVQHQPQQVAPTVVATPVPTPVTPSQTSTILPQVAKHKPTAKASFVTAAKLQRERLAALEDNTEIATDYLPLTYVAQSEERSGQVVRVEMPRSAMLALGLPINNEPTGDMVKADVIVGDDGLALAIRFVRNVERRSE